MFILLHLRDASRTLVRNTGLVALACIAAQVWHASTNSHGILNTNMAISIQMGFAQTASVLRGLAMKYIQRIAPIFSRHPEGMSRHVVDEKGVFIANFLIARR